MNLKTMTIDLFHPHYAIHSALVNNLPNFEDILQLIDCVSSERHLYILNSLIPTTQDIKFPKCFI